MIQYLLEILRIYKETFPTLLFSGVIALLPGYFLAHFFNEGLVPAGLLMLIPGLIGMRGNIFGALCSKITTLNNSIRNSDDVFAKEEENETINHKERITIEKQINARYQSSIAEVLFLSTILPILSHIYFLHFTGGAEMGPIKPDHHYSSYEYENNAEVLDINIVNNHSYPREHILPLLLFICNTSGLISGLLLLKCTQIVIKNAQMKGFDADNIAPPLITTLGDVITLPIISLCSFIAQFLDFTILWFFNLTNFALVLYLFISLYRFHPKIFSITIKERIPILLGCLTFSSIAGLLLERFIVAKENSKLFQLVLLIPLVNGQGGNAGSIYSSRISSSLALFYRENPHCHVTNFLNITSDVGTEKISKMSDTIAGNLTNEGKEISEKRSASDSTKGELSVYLPSSSPSFSPLYSTSSPSPPSLYSLVFDKSSIIINGKRVVEVIAITLSLFSVFSILIFYVTYFFDFTLSTDVSQSFNLPNLFHFFTALSIVLGSSSLLFAIFATIFSLYFRYDPDNTTIAVVCAFMDIIGTFCLCYLSSFFL